MGKNIRNLQITSVIVILITVLVKLLGLIREMKIAEVLGATKESDAYNVAYLLVITIFGLFSSAYVNSLMPVSAKLYKDDRTKLGKTMGGMLSITISIMLVLIFTVYLFPSFYVKLLAGGLTGEALSLASELVKISTWSLVALVIISAFTVLLRLYDRNIYTTATELIFPIPILVAAFTGFHSPEILISCLVLGYALRALLLWAGSIFVHAHISLNFKWNNPYIKDMFCLMPPMLVSSGLLQINTLVDNQVASLFSTGSITALQQAAKVNSLAYTVFSTSLLQIAFAKMSKAHVSGNKDEFNEIIQSQVKTILLFIIPCAIVLPFFSTEIIQILFLRGNYSVNASLIAGKILLGYSLGLIIFVLRDIFVYIFYSLQDSKTPTSINMFAIGINIVLCFTLSHFVGIAGIAYATSLSALISLILLSLMLKRKIKGLNLISKSEICKFVFAAFVDIALVLFLKKITASFDNLFIYFVIFGAVFLAFWLVYYILDFILCLLRRAA
ncbi:murein biosynthesis integral membrane protein MurJ [Bifidobacterium sp. SO1]|uniref:murein biosynthesis integral membrane protein MurJ n=1 Tax=Bifidobacterium sp. SO1 TaxID=2809029 RepID=UPI001BDC8F2E|nr:murein biosynthesis integral membrane protein MurJ [Bifidobacterium sp. SO1]MBT1160446.1 murein biosynthesis integral membrane protein MurJ [Bifidobacterium sp. SO1]